MQMKASMAILGLALLSGTAAAAPSPPVSSLGWLAGTWVEEKNGRITEERWGEPRGGTMLGTTLTVDGEQTVDFEFARIAADAAGTVRYWASVKGAPAVPFKLVSASGTEVSFENPAHDFPRRIAYRRSGNSLVATISGPGGAHPISWHYLRR